MWPSAAMFPVYGPFVRLSYKRYGGPVLLGESHFLSTVPANSEAEDAWTHSLGMNALAAGVRTICSALVRTVQSPSFTGRIALFRHRLRRIRFRAAMSLIAETPLPNRLIRDGDAALSEEVLDVAEAQAESVIQPHRVTDDLGRESIAAIVGRPVAHPSSLSPLCSTSQCHAKLDWCPMPHGAPCFDESQR